MRLLYDLGLLLYRLGIFFAAPFHTKAKKWMVGRKGWRQTLQQTHDSSRKWVWFHCASVGEFEQGRPLIESFREAYPHFAIHLTFFSPSGYELRKNYPGADAVTYLPPDTPGNARFFLDTVQPEMVFFVKYEFWLHFLSAVSKRGIPLFLVSGIFRKHQVFFRNYGGAYRKVLGLFSHLFVQDMPSLALLKKFDIHNVTVAGDTRFDRVWAIANAAERVELVSRFCGDHLTLVAGSTWPKDEALIVPFFKECGPSTRLILVPHEISEGHIQGLVNEFPDEALRFSQLESELSDRHRILVVDNVGWLSRIYRHGHFAYVGGGFGSGIHNILEAATFGLPIIFGPNYGKFNEAHELLEREGAFVINDQEEMTATGHKLFTNRPFREQAGEQAKDYVAEKVGATETILGHLKTLGSFN